MSPHPRADGLVQGERAALPLNFLAVGQGWVRTVIPVPRGDHLSFRAARFFPPR